MSGMILFCCIGTDKVLWLLSTGQKRICRWSLRVLIFFFWTLTFDPNVYGKSHVKHMNIEVHFMSRPDPCLGGPQMGLRLEISNKYRCFEFLGPKSTLLLHTLLDHGATGFAICALRLFFQNSTLLLSLELKSIKAGVTWFHIRIDCGIALTITLINI